MKIIKDIKILAALLFAGATFTACSSSSDNDIIEPTPTQPSNGKYTLTVNASKSSSATTRALSLDGNTLNATWKYGDVVYVTKESGGMTQGDYGKLMATNVSADGLSCTLTGSISGLQIGEGDVLTLRYHNGGYASQEGTIDYIAEKCDVAIATVTVDKVENGLVTTTGNANFESQQAIVKFSLKQPDGTTSLDVDYFLVKVMYFVGNDETVDAYKVTPDAAMSDIYVAIKGNTNIANVTLTALSSSGKYTYEKSSVTFQNGKYYAISVKMKEAEATNLSTLNGNYNAPDGALLTGELSGKYKVSIKSGATVILNGVTINGEKSESYKWAGITCEGSATIILSGNNTVKGFYNDYPGIYVPSGKTLTIKGSGSLNASSNGGGAGIGGGNDINCGKIVIEGGNITATGGGKAAGIGGGQNATCGDITINGGTITATGGIYAAGIGSGYKLSEKTVSCGNITITGGTVIATGGEHAAGIGSGERGTCGNITITNYVTCVTAKKGTNASNSIGAGEQGTCGTVTIGGVSYGTNGVGPNQNDGVTYIYQP